jgi:hypothetical protein
MPCDCCPIKCVFCGGVGIPRRLKITISSTSCNGSGYLVWDASFGDGASGTTGGWKYVGDDPLLDFGGCAIKGLQCMTNPPSQTPGWYLIISGLVPYVPCTIVSCSPLHLTANPTASHCGCGPITFDITLP